MSKDRNPFVGYSFQELRNAEATLFVIQLGEDFFVHDGEVTFVKDEAEEHFEVIYNGVSHMLKNGTVEEREDARELISKIRIMPLRFH